MRLPVHHTPTAASQALAPRVLDRRRLLFSTAALLGGAALGPVLRAAAQDEAAPGLGHVPTTGVRRPGPIGPTAPLVARREGVLPVAIQIPKAGVDASIEYLNIVDTVMQNPSGPWVVGWYQELAKPGGTGNAVMSGHVDYWEVGPAVFYYLDTLAQGDPIDIFGEDGSVHTYLVDWLASYSVAELTTETIDEIVGDVEGEKLTLITCGGTFNVDTGEYDQRMAVRASLATD